MERYEVNKTLETIETTLADLKKALDIDALNERLLSLSQAMERPDFWQDTRKAKKTTQESNHISEQIGTYNKLQNQYEDVLMWFSESEEGTESWEILESEIHDLKKELRTFEVEVLLSEPYDMNNAIVELHPGAGGTESQDWGEMLFRMYQRYAQLKNFKVELLDYQAGDEAGIKSVTMLIKGPYAYGYLKSERGVHRLVRISPFDSNARRHTSFVSCDVMPEFDDESEVIIKDEELKIDVYRSSGAGGQSVNTTDSAVRITHLPTGTVVTCQNERSQIKNRETAMNILKSKLFQLKLQEKEAELQAIKGEQKEIGWGSQIRSYVFHPYQLVKDHRTNYEVGNIASVMNGEIDGFINAFLKMGDPHE